MANEENKAGINAVSKEITNTTPHKTNKEAKAKRKQKVENKAYRPKAREIVRRREKTLKHLTQHQYTKTHPVDVVDVDDVDVVVDVDDY